MATTRSIRVHAHVQAAITSLRTAHQALQDALALSGNDVQLEATTLAARDLLADVTIDAEVLDPKHLDTGKQFEQHVFAFRAQSKPVPAPVAAQVTVSPVDAERDELIAAVKAAKLKGSGLAHRWKTETLRAKLFEHQATTPKPEKAAKKPDRKAKETQPPLGDAAERAELLAKLVTLDTQTLRELVALATTPAKNAA